MQKKCIREQNYRREVIFQTGGGDIFKTLPIPGALYLNTHTHKRADSLFFLLPFRKSH